MFMCVYLCIKLLYKRKHHFIKDCTLSCSHCSVSQWKLGLYVTPLVVIRFLVVAVQFGQLLMMLGYQLILISKWGNHLFCFSHVNQVLWPPKAHQSGF